MRQHKISGLDDFIFAAIVEAMTFEQLRYHLGKQAKRAGSQAALAIQLGVSAQHLSDIITGRRTPGKKLLEKLELERTVEYRSVSKAQ
jgi:transcriptional regulator with XRE-family HTH domain